MPEHTNPQFDDQVTPVADVESSAGDDVMRILADVEGHLNRLRTAQKVQDDALLSLADRAKALRIAEDEIEQARQEMAQHQQSLQRERTDFQAQRAEFESQSHKVSQQLSQAQTKLEQEHATLAAQTDGLQKRQSDLQRTQQQWDQQRLLLEGQLNQRHGELENRSADLTRREAGFKAEQDRVGMLSKQCQQQEQELRQRSQQMDEERKELLRRVEQAEANVGELIDKVERSQQQLSEKNHELRQTADELAHVRQRAAGLEKALHDSTQRADQVERDSLELARLADHERQELEQKFTAQSAQLREAHAASEVLQAQLDAARTRVAALEQDHAALQAQLAQRGTELANHQRKLELASSKLSEFAQVLSEQTPQLERGAAALAMVQQQEQQIERLTKQLAEAKLRTDPEEMQRRDQRIAELTEALRQARGQSARQSGIAELEQRTAELTSQVDTLKLELENAQVAAAGARRQLQERADAQSVPAGQEASLAEHAAKIAALTAEIEQLQARAAADLKAQLESQEQRHEQRMAQAHGADAAALQASQQRIAELETHLAEAHSGGASMAGSPRGRSDQAQKLRDKAQRISAVAEHLQRRRARLAKLRRLLVGRSQAMESSPGGRMSTEEVLQLEQDRAQLGEVARMLAHSERHMIRKWAGQRAVATIAWMFILATVCAGASWYAANSVAPPRISASVVLEARSHSRDPLTTEQAESWRAWHSQAVVDPEFQRTLAKRLAERRLDRYADERKIGQRLRQDLTIDASRDGAMTLTLAGTDGQEITSMLDVIAGTLAVESTRQLDKRADNAPAVIANERREDGRTRYASVNPVPIRDERFHYALPIFGALFALTLMLIAVVYTQLVRAKRVFDNDAGAAFGVDAATNMT